MQHELKGGGGGREREKLELNSHGIKHGLKYTDKS